MIFCVAKQRLIKGVFNGLRVFAGFGVFMVFMTANPAQANTLPRPEKKPDLKAQPSLAGQVMDFANTLLDFGRVPVPQKKPDFAKTSHKELKTAEHASITRLLKAYQNTQNFKSLSSDEERLYKDVFAKQKAGDMAGADKVLAVIQNPALIGHVLYQRYMHPKAYKSSFAELQRWMRIFADHPGARKIYTLAQKKGQGKLTKPNEGKFLARLSEPTMRQAKPYVSNSVRSAARQRELKALEAQISRFLKRGEPAQALAALKASSGFDQIESDILKSKIAAGYMYLGDAEKALSVAQKAVQSSGVNAPNAAWVAALMSWHQKKYSASARYFEMAARSPYASGWLATAGAYWAARAHMRVGNVKAVSTWLRRGTQYPRTFYGLISTRALGRDFDFNWQTPTFTREMHNILSAIPAGRRAIALVQAKQYDLAQAELLRTVPQSPEQQKAMLAFAGFANLPGLSMRLANVARTNDNGQFYDAAMYPVGPWEPQGGFQVNEALVYAIVRQESRFDPEAESPSGAKGLMQLMPRTAKFVAGEESVELEHPEKNLALGQKYLEHLLALNRVQGDFLSLLIAYNAGPGNLGKWKARWPDVTDPLLFIELLPSSETRAYVERVLSNYWIYRMRAGQPTPSLDSIASGKPAQYASAD